MAGTVSRGSGSAMCSWSSSSRSSISATEVMVTGPQGLGLPDDERCVAEVDDADAPAVTDTSAVAQLGVQTRLTAVGHFRFGCTCHGPKVKLGHAPGHAVRADLRADFGQLQADFGLLRSEFGELRGEVAGQLGELSVDISRQLLTLGRALGGLMIAMLGTILTLGFTGAFA